MHKLMYKGIFLVILCFTYNLGLAQKLVKKSLINPEISFVSLDTKNCFALEMSTIEGNEMIVEATIDGEYKKDLIVKIEEQGKTVHLSAGFSPNFVNPNDKLSAHKVVSIALKIKLPKHKDVKVYGTSCNITASGLFNSLEVILDDGTCTLKQVEELAKVSTQSGDITLYSRSGRVLAHTKYGKLSKERIPKGNNTFTLQTVTGNISLIKSN